MVDKTKSIPVVKFPAKNKAGFPTRSDGLEGGTLGISSPCECRAVVLLPVEARLSSALWLMLKVIALGRLGDTRR